MATGRLHRGHEHSQPDRQGAGSNPVGILNLDSPIRLSLPRIGLGASRTPLGLAPFKFSRCFKPGSQAARDCSKSFESLSVPHAQQHEATNGREVVKECRR